MREIKCEDITRIIAELCIKANCFISQDIKKAFEVRKEEETSPIGQDILDQLLQNADLAGQKKKPICQDTGMAVVFCDIGQEVHVVGGDLEQAIHAGVREGYEKGFLRKSVVKEPLDRVNTGDNTPAIIHYNIVPGDQFRITVAPKGFGSENMSRIYMLKPADGIEGVKNAIIETVENAGPNACPPIIIGVGIGGTFEKAALMAKRALLRNVEDHSEKPPIKELEIEMLNKINKLGIGPQGLGGRTTALAIHIDTYPTHIAGLPVAINISCHVTRHESASV